MHTVLHSPTGRADGATGTGSIQRLRWLGIFFACSIAAGAAFDQVLDPRDVAQAIAIGQSRVESDRTRFHLPYRLPVNRPPIDYIDVVTPFRSVVLEAESRVRVGDRLFGQREAFAVLAAGGGRVRLYVELSFHPLNTLVGVPPYAVTLVPAGSTTGLEPDEVERIPRFGIRIDGLPPGTFPPGAPTDPRRSEPMLGGTVVASFDGSRLGASGVYDVVLSEAGKELARARIDLGKLR